MCFLKISIFVILVTPEKVLKKLKSKDLIKLICTICKNEFKVTKNLYNDTFKGKGVLNFCSQKCNGKFQFKSIECTCLNCNKIFFKKRSQIKKSPNNFCSKSCAVTYNNKNKTKGNRRSKLEIWLEEQLTLLYPNLQIIYNGKEAINSELDIYIPSLKLAFELNGIFHYEPIYGEDKLQQITNNDNRKFQACLENKIELCIIDTSKLNYFKESNAIPFLNIILNILKSRGGGIQTHETD